MPLEAHTVSFPCHFLSAVTHHLLSRVFIVSDNPWCRRLRLFQARLESEGQVWVFLDDVECRWSTLWLSLLSCRRWLAFDISRLTSWGFFFGGVFWLIVVSGDAWRRADGQRLYCCQLGWRGSIRPYVRVSLRQMLSRKIYWRGDREWSRLLVGRIRWVLLFSSRVNGRSEMYVMLWSTLINQSGRFNSAFHGCIASACLGCHGVSIEVVYVDSCR